MDTTDVSLLWQESDNEHNATWQKKKKKKNIKNFFSFGWCSFAIHIIVFAKGFSGERCIPVLG